MKVKVCFFASMRERMGASERMIEVRQAELNVDQLWSEYLSQESLPANTLIAVNMEYSNRNHRLKDGDEVAFFPPVTGG
ncbi:MAG: molybdopterin converting factor subunit 1 [Pseudomonadota bacterium]